MMTLTRPSTQSTPATKSGWCAADHAARLVRHQAHMMWWQRWVNKGKQ